MTAQGKNPADQAGSTATFENREILAQWREFGKNTPEGGFVRVPRAVLTDPRLRPTDKLTWIALAAHVWGDTGKAWPSESRIARMVGCSSRTVRDAIARLERDGYLKLRRRPGRTSVVISLRFRVVSEGNGDEGNSTHQPRKNLPGASSTPEKSAGGQAEFAGGGRQKLPPPPAVFAPYVERSKKKEGKEERPAAVALAGQRPADPAAGHHNGKDPVDGDGQAEDHIEAQARRVLDDLNEHAGTHWRPNDVNLEPIRRRLREGYDATDLLGIIIQKTYDWADTPMARHLKPSSLFGKDERFYRYLGESEHWADNLRQTKRLTELKQNIVHELGRLRQQYRAAKEHGASEEELREMEQKGKQLKAQLQKLEARQQELDREFEEFLAAYR